MKELVAVAVTSRSFSRHPVLRAEVLARYPHVTFNDKGVILAGDELIAFLTGHDKTIVGLERLDEAVFSALPALKVVSKYGVGLDTIDTETRACHGVRLGWTGGLNKRSVSELVISFAVALLRHVPIVHAEVRAGTWRQPVGRQLSDRSVGIIGCGHIGKDLAQLLRAFGCRVLAHDILDFPEYYAAHGVEPVGLEPLLKTADVVTLNVTLVDSTRNIL